MHRKDETNEQFIVRMMNFARSGPLMQMFIIDALMKQARAVAQSDMKDDGKGLINLDAWKRCAVELDAELTKMYGPAPQA